MKLHFRKFGHVNIRTYKELCKLTLLREILELEIVGF